MKTEKLNTLENEVQNILKVELDRTNELHNEPQCSFEKYQFSINALIACMMSLDDNTANPFVVNGAQHQFEMVANSRLQFASYLNYGEENEVYLLSKTLDVLNVSFGLSNNGRVSKLLWLKEVAPSFLHTEINPKDYKPSKIECKDEGFVLASNGYKKLKNKLKQGVNVYGTLNTAYAEYEKNGILGWEHNSSKITEIDVVNAALFLIYIMNPIQTIKVNCDENNLPNELIIQIGQEQVNAYNIYHLFRNQGLPVFEALAQMRITLNTTILSQMIREKLEKEEVLC